MRVWSQYGSRAILPTAILAFGAVDAWCRRDVIYSDGISYLEIGNTYARGEWRDAINAYWSPLYSWILAGVFAVFRPQPADQLAWLHFINWLLLCAAAVTFAFFLRELRAGATRGVDRSVDLTTCVPHEDALVAIGWTTFAWGCLWGRTIGLFRPLPDIAIAGVVFAAAGLLLRTRASLRGGCVPAALLGVVLGIGYVTKAAMLPVALVFVVCTGRARRAAVAAIAFAAVCSPFMAAVSLSKGRFTTGESGRLNYAWEVGPVRRSTHWQGGPPGYGEPAHPTRVLLRNPLLMEFASPIPGSYPPWRDPSYWYEGVKPRFEAARQARALYLNSRYALALFLLCPAIVASLAAMLLSRRRRAPRVCLAACAAGVWRMRFILVPCIAAVLMYACVFVEGRYIAPFLVVAGTAVLAASFGASELQSARRKAAIVAAAAAITLAALRGDLVEDASVIYATLAGHPRATQAQLAAEMQQFGIRPGMRLGYIGLSMNAYWVALAGARIVCEVPIEYVRQSGFSRSVRDGTAELDSYWKSPREVRDRVLQLMSEQGAEYAIADMVPGWADTSGWTQLRTPAPKGWGDSRTFVRRLEPSRRDEREASNPARGRR